MVLERTNMSARTGRSRFRELCIELLVFGLLRWGGVGAFIENIFIQHHLFRNPASLQQSSKHSRGTQADSRTDSRGGVPSTTFDFACVHGLFSCQVFAFERTKTRYCDNLRSSSVQTRRRAQVVRDFVSFAVLGFICDNLWSSSVQVSARTSRS